MAKTKKQKEPKDFTSIKKIANLVMAVADLGAVVILSLVEGQKTGIASRVIAVPIALDMLIRLSVIAKPYFSSK